MKLSNQNRIHRVIDSITPGFGIAAFLSLFLKFGFYLPEFWLKELIVLDEIIAGFFVLTLLINFFISDNKWTFVKQSPFEFILLFLFIFSIVVEEIVSIEEPHYILKRSTSHNFIKLYFVLIQVYIIVNGIISFARTREKWLFFSLSPAKILVISYLFVITLGTLMLKLPKATYDGITWIDALFTSTSAICITGLSTLNLSRAFTFEGQLFILLLIQLGGLGIITLTSFIALFIQRGLRLRDQIIVQEVFDNENFSAMSSILKSIVAITFTTELIGAAILYFSWANLDIPEFQRFFGAIFHSVSAYCNAGFSIFPKGFETPGYQFNTLSLIVVMVLIVSGGLGFFTYANILHVGELKMFRRKGLTTQTKIILISTLGLILFGASLVWALQHNQWKEMSTGKQVIQSFFLSITSRTAGFSTVSIRGLGIPTLMVVILLMYIGGAPNSTSGGIKLTTAVTLLASVRAFIIGKNRVEIGWNTIPMKTVRRAFIVFLVSVLLIFIVLFFLSLTEDHGFFDLLFEIVSAFGTVGLSRGITPDLSFTGKILISFVMFAGRIGLFTFAVAMSEERSDNGYHFPEMNLMVG